MALPKGWDETRNEWRRRLRDPADFTRIRPKKFEGIAGVYIVGGPLKGGDGAFVPQALRFSKAEWPSLTAAVGWFEASRFASRLENPGIVDAIRPGDRVTIVNRFGQKKTGRAVMRSSHGGWVLNMGGPHGTPGLADESNIVKVSTRRENPPLRQNQPGGKFKAGDRVALHAATSEWMQGDRYGTVVKLGRARDYVDSFTKQTVQAHPVYVKLDKSGRTVRFHPDNLFLEEPLDNPKSNPPRRLEAFRAGAETAIEKLAHTESELSALFVQALELSDRGERVPEWIRSHTQELEAEKRRQLEDVRTAVARHGAAIEEFSTSPTPGRARPGGARRENPARVKAEAVRLYEQFHGHAPTGYRLERVPDLSQLVALGRVLRIDYQLDPRNARGNRNTPYSHEFGPGSTLLTDPTGHALVIVGNLKVSRADRGRFGYIRTASGG